MNNIDNRRTTDCECALTLECIRNRNVANGTRALIQLTLVYTNARQAKFERQNCDIEALTEQTLLVNAPDATIVTALPERAYKHPSAWHKTNAKKSSTSPQEVWLVARVTLNPQTATTGRSPRKSPKKNAPQRATRLRGAPEDSLLTQHFAGIARLYAAKSTHIDEDDIIGPLTGTFNIDLERADDLPEFDNHQMRYLNCVRTAVKSSHRTFDSSIKVNVQRQYYGEDSDSSDSEESTHVDNG